MTSNEQFNRERELFAQALEVPVGAERERFLKEACGHDAALRERLEGLLRAHKEAEGFLPKQSADPRETLAAGIALAEAPGTIIGRYKLLQQIGEGGCGVVYMAEQEEPVRRRVALKVIKLGMDTKSVIARFEAERQALALMDHPNIARVLDAGATETGRPYFVMELVKGIRITEYCDQNSLSTADRLDLFTKVCSAIQHAHQKGIIHRDIKPSNILVTLHDGVPVPKVIDFGIAKATDQRLTDKTLFTAFEQFMGTPAYMSPEQAEMSGLDIDTRTDIYSLGVLLYELLTGKTPFNAKELLAVGLDEMRRTIREKEPARPSTRLSTMLAAELTTAAKQRQSEPPKLIHLLSGDLDWIVMKCLEKDRTRRYDTANSLALDLTRHLANEPITARPPSNLYRIQKFVRRNKLAVAGASAVAAALVLGLTASLWLLHRETLVRERAVLAEKAAETESDKSKQVAQFLKDMLAGVGPSVARGRDTTLLKEILSKTEKRLSNDLGNRPEVEAELRSVLSRAYDELGDYEKAEILARETLQLRQKIFGQEHPRVASSLRNFANTLWRSRKFEEAESALRRALAMQRKFLGHETKGHGEVADTLYTMGWVLLQLGKLDEAEAACRECLDITRKFPKETIRSGASSLMDLGSILVAKGDLAGAEAAQREGLELVTKRSNGHSEETPTIALMRGNLGRTLKLRGDLEGAEEQGRRAVAIQKRVSGADHPDYILALQQLSVTLADAGKIEEAAAGYRECYEFGRERATSDEEFFSHLKNYYQLLRKQKRLAAEPILREGLAKARNKYTNSPALLGYCVRELADIEQKRGNHSDAERLHRETLEIHRTRTPTNMYNRLTAMHRLGLFLATSSKPEAVREGQQLLEEYFTTGRQYYTNNPAAFEKNLNENAWALYRETNYAAAERLYREAIRSRAARLTKDNRDLLDSKASLARLLADWAWQERTGPETNKGVPTRLERAREAERLLQDCLSAHTRNTDSSDRVKAETKNRLGFASFAVAVCDESLKNNERLARFMEVETQLLESNERLQQSASATFDHKQDAVVRLVRLYEAWDVLAPTTGKASQAEEWRKKLRPSESSREDELSPATSR